MQFHDATVHSEIILDNMASRFAMGDMNNSLVALASEADADDQRQR